MKHNSWSKNIRIGLIVLPLVLLMGCKTLLQDVTPTISGVSPNMGSAFDPVEQEIGLREHPKVVRAYGGVYSDAKLEKAMSKLLGRLVAASTEPDKSFRVTVLNSPMINAFSLPGGYLYITRGLLALANDKSEAAAVLAHEMSHVIARHAIKRAKIKQQNALTARVMDNMVGKTEKTAKIKATHLVTLASFSQMQEYEADRLGIDTVYRAGLDPFAASRFLASMGAYSKYLTGLNEENKKTGYLSTHPSTPERIQAGTMAARRHCGPNIGARERDDYLEAIDNMLYGDSPGEGFIRNHSYIHPELRIRFTLPEGYRLENTKKAVLAVAPNGTAMRFDGVSVNRDVPLTTYLTSGWITGLLTGSIREQKVNGLPAVFASAQAKGWSFRIALIRVQSATYRFVFATNKPDTAYESAVSDTINSFQMLTYDQARIFKPLVMTIQTVRKGDSVASLSRKMKGVNDAERLFRILNGLKSDERIKKGQKIKIVSEQK